MSRSSPVPPTRLDTPGRVSGTRNVQDPELKSATLHRMDGASRNQESKLPGDALGAGRAADNALPDNSLPDKVRLPDNVRSLNEVPGSRALEDAAIVAALERGDRGAARKFHERIERAIFCTVAKVLGPQDHEFEDVIQLSLERVVLSVSKQQYAGRCNLTTWASVIASRVAIDHLRRRRHERRIFWFRKDEEDSSLDVPAQESSRPDRQYEMESKLKVLRHSLGKISPDKAEAVVLFEVMGHDLPQIADLTGVSLAAAQSRLVRGRKELAHLMRRNLGERDD